MDKSVRADAQPPVINSHDRAPPRLRVPMAEFPPLPDGLTVFGGVVDMALYKPEALIAKEVGVTPTEWSTLAQLFEREGMPAIDPVVGMRYWPAVRAWLDQRHGMNTGTPPGIDGVERW